MEGKERQGQGKLRTRQLLTVWEQVRISDAAVVTCIERPALLARLPCSGPSCLAPLLSSHSAHAYLRFSLPDTPPAPTLVPLPPPRPPSRTFLSSWKIWMASSRVGVSTSAPRPSLWVHLRRYSFSTTCQN